MKDLDNSKKQLVIGDLAAKIPVVQGGMGKCRRCVVSCDPATTPYCISKALINAATGNCFSRFNYVGICVG